MGADDKGETLLSTRELAERLDYSYGHTRQLLADGKLDLTPVKAHPTANPKWRLSEVKALIHGERAAGSDAA